MCGKRVDVPYWQFPQGGMHPEEDPVKAAVREIKEEIGLPFSKLTVLNGQHQPQEKYTYHRPIHKDGQPYDGQEQRYVLFHWDGDISECILEGNESEAEFSEVKWLTWDELMKLAIPSRMFIYGRLRNNVPRIIKDYCEKGKVNAIEIELTTTGTNVTRVSPIGSTWGEYVMKLFQKTRFLEREKQEIFSRQVTGLLDISNSVSSQSISSELHVEHRPEDL